jgi:protein-disulfide isomerase
MTVFRRPPVLCSLLTVCGLVLAALSGTDLCSFDGCTDAHEYRFFGLHLALVGLVYFGLLAGSLLLASLTDRARGLVSLVMAGGAGAEVTLVHLQKNVIQAWCPLCLAIAAVVLLLCIVQAIGFITAARRQPAMNRRTIITKVLMVLVAATAGFLVSFTGIDRPEAAATQPSVALGKASSKVEVLVFSDWLCPVCVKVEPAIEAAFPALEKRARILFLDKPVHREAMNFVPYHLSFLVNEKGKYLQLRRALFELASKNRNPSLDDVKAAVAPLGVSYRQLSFMDVSQLMGAAQALSTQYGIKGTPTVVVVNSQTGKRKTLVGGKEISRDNLIKAVQELE